jgi:hypothetical protein
MYSRAIKADTTRARRVAVQLWADMYAIQVEREAAFKIKERWLDLLASLPSYKGGMAPDADVLDAVLKLGVQGMLACTCFRAGFSSAPVHYHGYIAICGQHTVRAVEMWLLSSQEIQRRS